MPGTSPNLTVEQNLALALRRGQHGASPVDRRERRAPFRGALASLELSLGNRLPARVGLLSSGQRQALSLPIAGFTKPCIRLLDEHTDAVDPQRAEFVKTLTGSIVASDGQTTLTVTRNMERATRLGNRLIVMHDGRTVVDVDVGAERKRSMSAADLLAEFARIKGGT